MNFGMRFLVYTIRSWNTYKNKKLQRHPLKIRLMLAAEIHSKILNKSMIENGNPYGNSSEIYSS